MSNPTVSISTIPTDAGYCEHALAVLDALELSMSEDEGTYLPLAQDLIESAQSDIRDALDDLDAAGWMDHTARWEMIGIPAFERADERADETVAGIAAAWVILTGVLPV